MLLVGLLSLVSGVAMWLFSWFAMRAARRIEAAAGEKLAAGERELQAKLVAARAVLAKQQDDVIDNQRESVAAAGVMMAVAARERDRIIEDAKAQAEAIAGDALALRSKVGELRATSEALRNVIDGYGDRYLLPTSNLLDELADAFSHKDAGQKLKAARKRTTSLVEDGEAAQCDYAEKSRREQAINFVLDAFNGKVDSILSRVKFDNHGTLSQQIRDAFAIVNEGGKPFRNARIEPAYLAARLDELKWGVTAQELRKEEVEEQKRLREQVREEEKARRDIERAQKEAAKEEDIIRKAMGKAQAEAAKASEEQRGVFEAQLRELQARLAEAEDKNQRAISMAQQTRRSYVYIISNIGSFGETVFKIGLTRRLDPMDRIWELGDASVPFDFDVHAIVLAEDAPALEHELHNHFVLSRVNKVNHRKEFFRATVGAIRAELDRRGMEAKWTLAAEAAEYRETLAIERLIASDEGAKERWINRQLVLDEIEDAQGGTQEPVAPV